MTSPNAPAEGAVARFGAALAALDATVDWEVVGTVYCDGDSAGFFDEERRSAVLDAGLKLASDLGEILQPPPEGGGRGRSLYVGAATAELAPILFESIVLGRRVHWVTLPSAETEELTRALQAHDKTLPKPHTVNWYPADYTPSDHIWMTSVLTDPDAFPALHDELYERRGTPEAIGGGHPKQERAVAMELVQKTLSTAAPTAILSTTNEELAVWEPLVEAWGGTLTPRPTGRTSGLVGDVIRHCKIHSGRRGWRQPRDWDAGRRPSQRG